MGGDCYLTDCRTDWAHCQLRDITAPRGEKVSPVDHPDMVFVGMDHVEAHSMQIIGRGLAGEMKSNCSRFHDRDVIYGRLRPYLNKVTLPGFDGLASAEFIVFPPRGALEPSFLAYRLNARDFVSFASHLDEGDRPRVNFAQIGAFEIRLPPLVEQRAIVAKIEALFSELDKGVEQLEQVAEQLKRYRQAVLKAAFEGKLTADWRARQQAAGTLPSAEDLLEQIQAERAARYEQQLDDWKQAVKDWEAAGGKASGLKKPRKPAKPKDLPPLSAQELADLPDLPEGWAWVRLGLAIEDPQYGTSKKCRYEVDGAGVLRIPNIQLGGIDDTDLKYAAFSEDERRQYSLVRGDILIIRSNGSVSLVGRPALVRDSDTEHLFAGYLVRLRPNGPAVSGNYLNQVLMSHHLRQQIEAVARSTSGVNNINSGEIRSLVIPACAPQEQALAIAEIDSRFSVLDELEKAVETGLKQAEALRQSILRKAFEGRLLSEAELAAVQADPAYETAEVLLERIRAEREQSGTGTKRGRKGGKTKTARLPKVSGPERYKQAAYAAYAVQRLAGRETFGRVQQMKLVYLIPHALAQESKVYARREAAGPLDPAIHKIEGLAKKNGWFTTRKIGQRYKYTPGAKIDEAVKFAKDKFGDKADRVDWLLEQFAKMDTERAELVATTFAVWNDHLIDGHEPSEDEIVAGVHGWHPEKVAKFPSDRIARCIQWMKDNSFVPTGIGPKTTR